MSIYRAGWLVLCTGHWWVGSLTRTILGQHTPHGNGHNRYRLCEAEDQDYLNGDWKEWHRLQCTVRWGAQGRVSPWAVRVHGVSVLCAYKGVCRACAGRVQA